MISPYPFPDELAPPGSSYYYAIRFAPRHQRSNLSLACAFFLSVRNIPAQCTDSSVAREKLHWWDGELQRAQIHQAAHPIASRIPSLLRDLDLPQQHLAPLFAAVGEEISLTAPADEQQLEFHTQHTTGLLTELLTRVGGGSVAELIIAKKLGGFIRQVEILRNLGQDLRAHRCFIPQTFLRQHDLSRSDMFKLEAKPAIDHMLRARAAYQHRYYGEIRNSLPETASALGPTIRLAAIADSLLQALSAEGCNLFQQRTTLTPLRKLWIAWRHR